MWKIMLFIATFFMVIQLSVAQIWTLTSLLMSGTKATYHGLGYEESVTLGVTMAQNECKNQFLWNPWNCPEQDFYQIFSKSEPLPATRETAFVHAIISAGIVHTIAQNCSRGDFNECGCHGRRTQSQKSEETKGGFRWGGCSDDVDFGMKVAKSFLDEQETVSDARTKMNLHNNNVGRMAVKSTMVKKCKCHGVSGSCTTQTCWMKVAPFHDVGNYLKETYKKAEKIGNSFQGSLTSKSIGRVRKDLTGQLPLSAISSSVPIINDNLISPKVKIEEEVRNLPLSKLAFTEDSPDYCRINPNSTVAETLGRTCSRRKGKDVSAEERKSCRNLCRSCGLKVKKQRNKVVNRHCNCKLQYCCEVRCETCITEEITYTCSL